jgi:hypothetical protein
MQAGRGAGLERALGEHLIPRKSILSGVSWLFGSRAISPFEIHQL